MSRCSSCPYGPYSGSSDWCDECRNEPHTGFYGFKDNKIGRDFSSEEERDSYVWKYGEDYEEDDD